MKSLIIIVFTLFSALSYAGPENDPTLICKLGHKKELKVYGPLGYLYEDDIAQTSEISFPNTVELIIDGKVVKTLPNSTSMVNEHNEYTVTSYVLGTRDLSLRKVINLFYASEEGSQAHMDINLEGFRYKGRGFCRLLF